MSGVKTSWSAQVAGDAARPAVVLLHSIATSGAMWTPQLAVWATQFHLIVPDLPGHGATPAQPGPHSMEGYADGVANLLDELGIERAAVVGVSLGGMIAQAFALRHPQRLTALVLAQTSARSSPQVIELWEQRKRAVREQGMRAQVPGTLQRWFTAGFLHTAPLTAQWVAEMIAATSVAGFAAAGEAIQSLDFLERLSVVTTPTLVVAGVEDTAVPPALAQLICAKLPNARLVQLAGAAHLANIEKPIEFTETIGGFLGEVLLNQHAVPAARSGAGTSL